LAECGSLRLAGVQLCGLSHAAGACPFLFICRSWVQTTNAFLGVVPNFIAKRTCEQSLRLDDLMLAVRKARRTYLVMFAGPEWHELQFYDFGACERT